MASLEVSGLIESTLDHLTFVVFLLVQHFNLATNTCKYLSLHEPQFVLV